MDAHYDQVMNARAKAGQGTRLYFGYSTILDRAAFEEWRGQHSYDFFSLPAGTLAVAKGLGLTYDFLSRWWGGRVAGLIEAPGSEVYGLVFEIAEQDWPIIQHKEGVVTGTCVEKEITVLVDGTERTATAFTTNPTRATSEGPISTRFLEALKRGATAAGLPSHYVEALSTVR